MARLAVVGSGAWGTALACHAARLGHTVTMWAYEPEVVEEIDSRGSNSLYLPDISLPAGIRAFPDAAEAVSSAEVVILVPPSKHLRSVSAMLAGALSSEAVLVVASKGIEEESLKLMSEVLAETLPDLDERRLAFLSGPSFAREVAQGLPTDVVLGSKEMLAAQVVQPMLHSPVFRVYSSPDPIGVQVGGAVKNVAAVAAGACDGLSFGTNARAALITRALAEITRLGVALGADPLTFLGLAGVGDLVLTCTGELSRNRTLGKQIAEGIDPKEYLASRRSVAEGFFTSAAAYHLSLELKVDMPITDHVFHVLHRDRPLLEAVRLLLSREFKEELRGMERDPAARSS
jgi:glycerol-3-phosphate dehydrogenase (NAD(P)+)